MPELGIILVVYNQSVNLEPLYKSLQKQSYKNFRIYFVDNNSTDNSVSCSKEINADLGLDVNYVQLNENTGYAKGNNIGAKTAISDKCTYLFFLNNDMVLEQNCLQELIKLITSGDTAVCAGPLILKHKSRNPDVIQEYGGSINFKTATEKKYFTNANIKTADIPEVMETGFISGGACMVKADIFSNAGMFEENYFAYLDEIDLFKRINGLGNYKKYVASKAVVWHNHEWSKKNKQGYYFEYYMIERNKFLYFHKYRMYMQMLLAFLTDLVKFPWRLVWFVKVCDFKLGMYYIKGMFSGLLNRHGKPALKFIE